MGFLDNIKNKLQPRDDYYDDGGYDNGYDDGGYDNGYDDGQYYDDAGAHDRPSWQPRSP